jgi:hypothetical protein
LPGSFDASLTRKAYIHQNHVGVKFFHRVDGFGGSACLTSHFHIWLVI